MGLKFKELCWKFGLLAIGFGVGGLTARHLDEQGNEPLSNNFKAFAEEVSGAYLRVATHQNLVTEEEMFEACVAGINEKKRSAVEAWLNEPPTPANP